MYGAGMIVEGMGLIHPVMSYCGDITISFTSCREMLPDPANYAAKLQASFDELAAATTPPRARSGKAAARAAVPAKRPAAKRRAPAKSAPTKRSTTTRSPRAKKAAVSA